MKKIILPILLISGIVMIYFFIKEQFKGIALSHTENIILSVTYLVIGICILMLFKIKSAENKK